MAIDIKTFDIEVVEERSLFLPIIRFILGALLVISIALCGIAWMAWQVETDYATTPIGLYRHKQIAQWQADGYLPQEDISFALKDKKITKSEYFEIRSRVKENMTQSLSNNHGN